MSQLCEDCRTLGLPVFPLRYAVAPDTLMSNSISPFSGERVIDVELGGGSVYTLRTLRSGFLYVFHEKGMHGANYWDAYAVANDGTLWKQASALAARPVSTPQCARTGHSATRMQYFVIEKPEKSGAVWLAFSEHKWSRATLDRYRSDAAARAKRMQKIEPAAWIAAQVAGEHKGILADAYNFNSIVEFAPEVERNATHNEPLACGHAAPAPAVPTSPIGQYDSGALRRCSSRYPWVMRNAPAGEQAEALLQAMTMTIEASLSDAHKNIQPISVALWDAIGIVHELNGYRHDVLGYFARYSETHALHLHAMQGIEAAKKALEQGAQNRAERNYEGLNPRGRHYSNHGRLRIIHRNTRDDGASAAFAREYGELSDRYRFEEIDLAAFRHQRAQIAARHSDNPATLEQELVTDEQLLTLRRNDRSHSRERAAAGAWTRYEQRLNHARLTTFEANFERLNAEREALLAQRLIPLKAWLESELFLDTLDDFHLSDLNDGIQYSEVIASAIDSLPVDAAGKEFLDELIARTNLSERNALAWRALAWNQTSTNNALTRFLAVATANKNTPMQTGLSVFSSTMELLKPLTDSYNEARQKRLPQMPSATTQAQRLAGQDRLVLAVGDVIFERFRVNAIGEFVGENLVKGLFLRRVGLHAHDVNNLITQEMQHMPALRAQLKENVLMLRRRGVQTPMAIALAELEHNPQSGAQAMQNAWQRLTTANINSSHLLAVVALCEASNFIKILSAQDKTTADYAMLLAAGMSTLAAIGMVRMESVRQIFGEGSASYRTWQMRGGAIIGGLSGVASLIGAAVDFREAKDHGYKGYSVVTVMYLAKGFVGFAAGGAFFVTALTASAPLIQRLVGRGATVIFLERMGSGLATAAATRGGQVVAQRSVLVMVGRGVLMLTGWKVTVAVLAVQGVIWIFTPNKLEQWIDGTPFGDRGQHRSLQQQDKKYGEALAEVSA